ncbi:hypothetical protein EXIGLDRAFT_138419 [Exidia glandulosa HHB12029]|uniref:Uncharacterized protein n=1 Tax=Exidia glandulosa HHB12029 TaxID=1314781 RepID=A0A165FZS3_EXIGL|nr:hypothetical protein EXIGLDRAFT_138419 [Exidia glandulosa HHB12029]
MRPQIPLCAPLASADLSHTSQREVVFPSNAAAPTTRPIRTSDVSSSTASFDCESVTTSECIPVIRTGVSSRPKFAYLSQRERHFSPVIFVSRHYAFHGLEDLTPYHHHRGHLASCPICDVTPIRGNHRYAETNLVPRSHHNRPSRPLYQIHRLYLCRSACLPWTKAAGVRFDMTVPGGHNRLSRTSRVHSPTAWESKSRYSRTLLRLSASRTRRAVWRIRLETRLARSRAKQVSRSWNVQSRAKHERRGHDSISPTSTTPRIACTCQFREDRVGAIPTLVHPFPTPAPLRLSTEVYNLTRVASAWTRCSRLGSKSHASPTSGFARRCCAACHRLANLDALSSPIFAPKPNICEIVFPEC